MKIGIIGTRGIPNTYGGFEQFAEQFSTRMADRGHEVVVYTSHKHQYRSAYFKKVRLVHCYDPEHWMGTAGQFVYDFNCIRHSRTQHFDIILQLGYTSSTIWSSLYPKDAVIVTNMDGLEWKRSKYNRIVRYFLTHAERWGVQHSDQLIADSKGIQEYLQDKYKANATFIAYGATVYTPGAEDTAILDDMRLQPSRYDLIIARFEPENNIETILEAYTSQESKLIIVGNYAHNAYGQRLYKKYSSLSHILFTGAIFDQQTLNTLRYYSRIYFHGHSVGGTNPSLLEAMGCNALVCAHNNTFNKHVLGEDAFYFSNTADILKILSEPIEKKKYEEQLANNREKIVSYYNWEYITSEIERHFKKWAQQ